MKPLDTEKIKLLIKERGSTQIDLARYIGLSEPQFINRMKKGDFWAKHIVKMSQFLNVHPGDLFSSDFLTEGETNQRNYINTRMKVILNDFVDVVSLVIDKNAKRDIPDAENMKKKNPKQNKNSKFNK